MKIVSNGLFFFSSLKRLLAFSGVVILGVSCRGYDAGVVDNETRKVESLGDQNDLSPESLIFQYFSDAIRAIRDCPAEIEDGSVGAFSKGGVVRKIQKKG